MIRRSSHSAFNLTMSAIPPIYLWDQSLPFVTWSPWCPLGVPLGFLPLSPVSRSLMIILYFLPRVAFHVYWCTFVEVHAVHSFSSPPAFILHIYYLTVIFFIVSQCVCKSYNFPVCLKLLVCRYSCLCPLLSSLLLTFCSINFCPFKTDYRFYASCEYGR